jgi:hypothetical protein
MRASRIPDFNDHTPYGMQWWFAEMSARDLIFHCEDSPREMFIIADGERMFTDRECAKLEGILATMYEMFGDGVVEAECPIFMKKAGALHALDS